MGNVGAISRNGTSGELLGYPAIHFNLGVDVGRFAFQQRRLIAPLLHGLLHRLDE